jgi:hypothetical protein
MSNDCSCRLTANATGHFGCTAGKQEQVGRNKTPVVERRRIGGAIRSSDRVTGDQPGEKSREENI